MRFGPGLKYAVKFVYTAPGLPLQIVEEFDHWRQVRDPSGEVGWMHRILLSGRRTARVLTSHNAPLPLRKRPDFSADIAALMQDGLLVELDRCEGQWCSISVRSGAFRGYARRDALWGADPLISGSDTLQVPTEFSKRPSRAVTLTPNGTRPTSH